MAKPVPIESVLGPAIERYFAFGYRRVSHDLSHVFLPDQAMELHAIGTATYPNDWSIDSQGRPREAHLSSVDAITLAALAFERFADLHAQRGRFLHHNCAAALGARTMVGSNASARLHALLTPGKQSCVVTR